MSQSTTRISAAQRNALKQMRDAEQGKQLFSFKQSSMSPGWLSIYSTHEISISTLRALRNRGLIELPSFLRCRLTDAGRAVLNEVQS